MRALVAVACLALSLGCASMGAMPATDNSGPLRAYLLPHTELSAGMSFHVSKPAHVAVFRIIPGRGTAMVYPRSGNVASSRALSSGFHNVAFSGSSAWSREQNVGFASTAMGPEFYFMIASEEPLRLGQVGAFGSRLNTAMGASFAYSGSFSAMERLVELTVPDVADESWTTDYYVHWPVQNGVAPRQRTFVQIACNGSSYTVPVELANWVSSELCTKSGVQPSDSTVGAPRDSIVEPRRRPPVEVTDRISSAQLSDPEVWEQLRGYAETAAVTRDLRTRRAVDADEFGGASGNESLSRSRPTTRANDSGSGRSASAVDTPRSRPAPEPASQPNSSAERERPAPSSDGSAGRALAPTQAE